MSPSLADALRERSGEAKHYPPLQDMITAATARPGFRPPTGTVSARTWFWTPGALRSFHVESLVRYGVEW